MFILWTGHGIVWPFAALAGPLAIMMLKIAPEGDQPMWFLMLLLWSSFATASLYSETIGKTKVTRSINPKTGKPKVSKEFNTIFFLPVRFLTLLLGLLCLVITIFVFIGKSSGTGTSTSPETVVPPTVGEVVSAPPEKDIQEENTIIQEIDETIIPDDTSPELVSPDDISQPDTENSEEDALPTPDDTLLTPEVNLKKNWVDDKGRIMTATLIDVAENPKAATFKKADGNEYTVLVSSLSQKDQALINAGNLETTDKITLLFSERTWINVSGKSMLATFIEVVENEDTKVRFRKSNGNEYLYPLDMLSQEDQNLITD